MPFDFWWPKWISSGENAWMCRSGSSRLIARTISRYQKPSLLGWMPPWMQTSDAPRATASLRAPDHVLERAVVGVFLVLVAREAAEAAAHVADVGEVDVAADHVGDLVADVVEARAVRHRAQHLQVATARAEQDLDVGARRARGPRASARARRARARSCHAEVCRRGRLRGTDIKSPWASPARRSTRAGGATSRARRTRAARRCIRDRRTAGRAARSRRPRCAGADRRARARALPG